MICIKTANQHDAMVSLNNDIIACLKKGFPFSLSGSNSYKEEDILQDYMSLCKHYGIPEVKKIQDELESYAYGIYEGEYPEVLSEFVDELERILLNYVDFTRIENELGHATVRRSNYEACQQMIVLLTRRQQDNEKDNICMQCGFLVKAGQPFWYEDGNYPHMYCRSCENRISELEEY
jgi:hypothetical protein